ncbi:hypothetical protein RN001_003344 [Aquatica leii]|uniref:Uncharacterized protein n=1 Tax=Aquatica leii TaxID=1421715 RepID=A0AAN7QP17_9COLE|nr:hypothetical protein RN001_003344 [Aquatica leii]
MAVKNSKNDANKLCKELKNAPFHVFGHYTTYSDCFCTRKNSKKTDYTIVDSNCFAKIRKMLEPMVNKEDRFSYNQITNHTENFSLPQNAVELKNDLWYQWKQSLSMKMVEENNLISSEKNYKEHLNLNNTQQQKEESSVDVPYYRIGVVLQTNCKSDYDRMREKFKVDKINNLLTLK